MPSNLTIKQESFCQEYLKKGSASEAYRGVYNARNMKVETIHRKAAELMANGKVTARIEELQSRIRKDNKITLDRQVEGYLKLIDQAQIEISEPSQKINAITRIMALLDKISGLEHRKDEEPKRVIRIYHAHPLDAEL